MLVVKKHGIIISPSNKNFESRSTFNPGVLQEGDTVHILYRAQGKDYKSSIGYARLAGPLKVVERWSRPLLEPAQQYESRGVEDARISKIGKQVYVVYVAHDGKHALLAYASGTDLFSLERRGIISPCITYRYAEKLFERSKLKDDYFFFSSYYKDQAGDDIYVWEKDGILFPEKIANRFFLMHRILPDIQLASASSIHKLTTNNFWKNYLKKLDKHILLEGIFDFESRHIGGGAPPIKTSQGWLIIYHAARQTNEGRVYSACAALLDYKNPLKTIARLPFPLITPEDSHERKGQVHDVVFPSGTAIFGKTLYIYYGAADTYVAVASINLEELLKKLMKHPIGKHDRS